MERHKYAVTKKGKGVPTLAQQEAMTRYWDTRSRREIAELLGVPYSRIKMWQNWMIAHGLMADVKKKVIFPKRRPLAHNLAHNLAPHCAKCHRVERCKIRKHYTVTQFHYARVVEMS